MSYQNQRGGYGGAAPNMRGESAQPKINEKRFGDVIDYSQPRPQSGYENRYGSDEEQTRDDDRHLAQRGLGPGRNQTNQGGSVGGYGNYPNGSYGANQGMQGGNDAYADNTQDGHALQLIQADPRTGKFILNEEVATELISNFEGNISFVTLAGKYRTGKSFLLNRLLNLRGEGVLLKFFRPLKLKFTVDPTTDSCTQGIWIWSKPVYNERDNSFIFFLDTEGSNSVEKSATHDAKIFALALLMSSYFIYNSVGNIDENSINDLSLTTQLSRNIAISTEETSENAISFYTPKFMWALRDFTLELRDASGRPISANQYLENALVDQSTYTKASETNKKIRQALLSYFKDRECMTFVRPANEEKDLKRLNILQNNQIRPEFLKQVAALRDKIYAKATPKQLKGVNLNMRMYIAMLQKYVEAINKGSVPNISTAWDHLVENECREAYEQSADLYDLALKQFFFNEEQAKSIEDLHNILKNIRDSALEKYNKMTAAIDRSEVVLEFKNELKDYVDKKEQQVHLINEELNQTNNQELLGSLSQIIRNNITSGVYGSQNIQDYHDDFKQFLTTYDAESQGLAKCNNLIAFLKVFHPEVVNSLMFSLTKSFQSNQKNYEQDKAKISESEKNLQRNLEILKEKERAAAEELARLKAEKADLANKTIKLNEEVNKIKEAEELLLEEERKKARLETAKLQEREKEAQELAVKNKELLDRMKKTKGGCCNMF